VPASRIADVDVFEAIRTTRAMRRLDPNRDVSDADLRTIVEAATKGATGGNRQHVRWLVVRDREKRRQLGELYADCAKDALAVYEEDAKTNPTSARMLSSARHLERHMGEAPAIILACAPGRAEASVFPGVQNLMLAARALGLGTTLTTIHRCNEDKVKAVLGIPKDVNTFCMIPVGYPLGRWGEAPRKPVEELAYVDEWGRGLP
jgi:nitroreductase